MNDAILALVALGGLLVTFLGSGIVAILWSRVGTNANRLSTLEAEHAQSNAEIRRQLYHAWREVTELKSQFKYLYNARPPAVQPAAEDAPNAATGDAVTGDALTASAELAATSESADAPADSSAADPAHALAAHTASAPHNTEDDALLPAAAQMSSANAPGAPLHAAEAIHAAAIPHQLPNPSIPQQHPSMQSAMPHAPGVPPNTLEEQVGLVWFTRIGAAALLLGVAYFFKYAIDNQWIGPFGRLAIGLVAGAAALGFAERGRARTKPIFSNMLIGIGVSILLFTAYASHAFYQIVPAPMAILFMAAVSIGGGLQAVRHRAEPILLLATLGAMSAPLLLSGSEDHAFTLFAYTLIMGLLAHWAAVKGRFRAAPWVTILGCMAVFGIWYSQHFDAYATAEALEELGLPRPSSKYLGLAARSVPIFAVFGLVAEWTTLYFASRKAGLDRISALAYFAAAIVFGHAGLALLLADNPPLLLGGFVLLAVLTVHLARIESAPALTMFAEATCALCLAVAARSLPNAPTLTVLTLAVRATIYVVGILTSAVKTHLDAQLSAALSILVFVGASAAALGPAHPLAFLALLAATSLIVVAFAVYMRNAWISLLACMATLPFLFVGAPSFALISMSSAGANADTTRFLLMLMPWTLVYSVGCVAGILVKREPPKGAALAGSCLAALTLLGFALTFDTAGSLPPAIALGFAAAYAALGAYLLQLPSSGLTTLAFGVGTAFAVIGLGLLLSGATLTIVWATLAALIAVFAARRANQLGMAGAFVVFGCAILHLLTIDSLLAANARELYFSSMGAQGELAPRWLLNPLAYSLFGLAAAMFVSARQARTVPTPSFPAFAAVLSSMGHFFALILVVKEARRWMFEVPSLPDSYVTSSMWRRAKELQAHSLDVVTTLSIAGYAIAILVLGFSVRAALPRYLGLALFAVAVCKLTGYDVWYLPRVYQISALVGVGALMLSASFVYARFGKRLLTLLKAEAPLPATAAKPESVPAPPANPDQ